jgi:hypothetical protein
MALGALAVYRTTLLPGVSAWDTAEAQTVLPLLGTMHPTGFPAYVVIGWLASIVLAPFGDPAFRVNLLSAILAATAAGTTVLVVRRFGAPLPVALAAAAGLALTPITWSIASAADAHALHLALLALLVLALVRWAALVDAGATRPSDAAAASRADRGILVAAALYGVMLANHGLTYLLAPAVAVYVLAVDRGVIRRPRLVAAALGTCLAVAGLLYLELPLRAGVFPAARVYGHPDTWSGFWEIVLARQFQGDVVGLLDGLPAKAADLARLASAQLGVLAWLVVPAFLLTAWRHPRYGLLSGLATAVTCLFAASYLNADIGRYYLGPALFAWTWLGIAATVVAREVLARAGRGAADPAETEAALDRPVPPAGLAARTTLALVLAGALLVPTSLALPARWREVDRSGDTERSRWLDEAMATFDRDAVVVSWWSTSTTLWYGTLVEGRRPDLLIVDDSNLVYDRLGEAPDVIDAWLGRRPVLLLRSSAADVEALAVRYVLTGAGLPAGVFRVTGLQETAP